jgi:FtsH-binding integral membrane protein
MGVSWLASRFSMQAQAPAVQYLALAGFVVAEALIFVPLLWMAFNYVPGAISSAAVVTLGGFGTLTFVVFWTRKDFSFIRAFLMWGGIAAVGLILVSLFTGFHLGPWFSFAMVAFACGAILYDTSNVLHHFPEDRHVGASLQLFASVALLFWYVLRLFIASRD